MEHIKMMEDLMRKSYEIKNNHIEQSKVSKGEMISKAKEKIEKYFDEVLENCPLKSLNIILEGEEIEIFIRKGSSDTLTEGKYVSDTVSNKFIILKVGYYYYTTKDEFVNKYWNKHFVLCGLEEAQILRIIKDFDLIKSNVENAIINRMDNILKGNAKAIEIEENNLKTLESFLDN